MSDVSNAFDLNTMAATPNLSPEPSVLAPQDSVLSADRAATMRGGMQNLQQAEEHARQIEQFNQRRKAALDPQYDAAERAVSQPIPQPPAQRQPPKPPTMEDAQNQDGKQAWLTAAMFLGALGGALTRRPLTNSLAAFTGIVEGFNEGNKQQFDTSMKTWEAENKRFMEESEQQNKAYDRILKARDLDAEQKRTMLQLESMRYKDEAMGMASQLQNDEHIAKLYDERLKYLDQFQKASGEAKIQMWEESGKRYAASPEGQRRVQRILNYEEPMPSSAFRGNEMGYRNMAVSDAVSTANPAFDAGGFRTKQTERTRRLSLYGRADEVQVQNQGTAINHLDTLEKLHTGLGNGDVNALNAAKQYAQQELGIAAPTSFDGARQLIGNEIVKAIVNNGGGVTDRSETSQNLSRVRSPDQMHDLIHTYQVLIAAQMAAKKRQYDFTREGVQGAPAFEASGHLTPRHLQLMQEAEKSFTLGANPEQSADPNVRGAQKSDLQRNIDAIFGAAQNTAGSVAGSVTGGIAGQVSGARPAIGTPTSQVPGYDRGRGLPQGWSLTPME
jgi:hypothetical protein